MNSNRVIHHQFGRYSVLDVSFDVSMDSLHPEVTIGTEHIKRSIANRTEEIMTFLTWIRAKAKNAGYNQLRVVAESTSVYHKLLFRIAVNMNLETALVDPSAVSMIRRAIFKDNGKTDHRDPIAIGDLASRNLVLTHRRLPEIYEVMRRYNKLCYQAEQGITQAKCRIHRCLKIIFPDLDFYAGFLYDRSGRAIMDCYSFNPHAIKRAGMKRVAKRLKSKVPRIRNTTIQRLFKYADASVQSTPSGRENDVHVLELQLAWEDLLRHEKRKAMAVGALELFYDEARKSERNLPEPVKGVLTKIALARFFGELGPASDFSHWRQVLSMAGLNLFERESGKWKGKTKISKTGRSLLRVIINQMVLPLVKKTRLFGPYYHHKKNVEKMKGTVAMTAVARKLIKMLWGIYKSGGQFSEDRVFTCESQFAKAA